MVQHLRRTGRLLTTDKHREAHSMTIHIRIFSDYI